MFTAQLIQEGRAGQTVRSYVSAVRSILKEDGIKLTHDYQPLISLLQSTKYTTKPSGQIRLPIQWGLVKLIADDMDNHYSGVDSYSNIMLKAILMAGYFGLLRIGEMTDSESNHTIKFCDVHFERQRSKILMVLHTSG